MTAQPQSEKSIFFAAIEIGSATERATFLERACASNQSLRAEVEALLQAHEKPQRLLDNARADLLRINEPQPLEQPGTLIGPYKLLEQIGEGGFGVVFMAEQLQPVRRKVALKVLKPGMDTRQIVARFEAERQALALMDHPHIAHIFDGGETQAGRPYFVMELVRGVPITEFSDQNHLTVQQRLELFVTVCQTVQHAHQKGIIHRDLKPSNVMVTLHDDKAVVKVIDFGIAKAVGQQLTDKTLFTNFAQMIGTPMYMSPEQAQMSGLDTDTRTDIYSLGVLLYELLTGTTPFDQERLRTATYDEMRRIIREEEPVRPSTRISTLGHASLTVSAQRQSDPRQLSQLLRGELDWIVLKALEKDRNRRYETANSLAQDIERYLHDEPVQACPPSPWYRFQKFARRNKGFVWTALGVSAALVLAVVALAVGNVMMDRERQEAMRQRDDARAQRQLARRAVDKMFTEVAEKWLAQQPGLEPMQRQFLEEALHFYEEFAKERGTDPELRLETGNAHRRVGEIQRRLGEYAKAEQSLKRAIALLEQLVAEFPSAAKYRSALAHSHDKLAHTLNNLDRPAEGAREHRQSLVLWEKIVAEFPDVADYSRDLALGYFGVGADQLNDGRTREAEESFGQAISLYEKLPAELANTAECRHCLGIYRQLFGRALVANGRPQEAERSLRQAETLLERVVGDFPHEPHYRFSLTAALRAHTPLELTRAGQAEKNLRRALAIAEKLVADFPAVPEYRADLSSCHAELGHVIKETGRAREAEEKLRQAVHLSAKLVVEFPTMSYFRQIHWLNCAELGHLLLEDGRLQEAEKIWRGALATEEQLMADFPTLPQYRCLLALSHHHLGAVLAEAGRPQEAEKTYRQAVAHWEKLVAEFPAMRDYSLWLALCHGNLAELFTTYPEATYRNPAEALKQATRAVELRPDVRQGWNALGIAHYRTGDWKAAVTALEKSVELGKGGYWFDWFFLAMAHWRLDHNEDARKWYDQAVGWMEKNAEELARNKPYEAQCRRYRAEAAQLLGMKEKTQ